MLFGKNEILSCVVVETLTSKNENIIKSILAKFKQNTGGNSIFNSQYLLKCPLNSVIVRINNPEKFMILYPFFSSHMSLPVKPGEHVWAFFPEGYGSNNIGYWMTRRSTDYYIEDANFTHNVRSSYNIYENLQIAREKSDNENSNYYDVDGPGLSSYRLAITNTVGNTPHVFEKIERITKKPGDLLIQGSNNNHILLTSGFEEQTGTIILTAGRGKTDETSAESIETEVGTIENNKASVLSKNGDENPSEGRLDILNDKTIFIMSENALFLNNDIPDAEAYRFNDMSVIFSKADNIRTQAVESITSRSVLFQSFCSNFNAIADSSIYLSSPSIDLSTSGWNVNMASFFTLVKDLASEVKKLTSGEATFATGVGPTGPATNLAKVQTILSKIESMGG